MEGYYSLSELFALIEEPNRAACMRIYEENRVLFENAKGSNVKHQAWPGGYLDHVREVMNIGIQLYKTLHTCRKLHFSLSDALLVLFLHDLEKPWKYGGSSAAKEDLESFSSQSEFLNAKVSVYGFELSDDHWNALRYTHGEGDDYDPHVNIQGPLGAFVHCCDVISARIWFDEPKKSGLW